VNAQKKKKKNGFYGEAINSGSLFGMIRPEFLDKRGIYRH
jgi:hypothetical protein